MYHVSAQGVDERMINVHYYYYINCGKVVYSPKLLLKTIQTHKGSKEPLFIRTNTQSANF